MSSIIDSIFDAKIAKRGGVVRRSIKALRESGCYEALVADVRYRGWPAWEIGDQLVIFCTSNPRVTRIN